MRFGSTAKVLLKCKLKYYRISECEVDSYIPRACVNQLPSCQASGHGLPTSLHHRLSPGHQPTNDKRNCLEWGLLNLASFLTPNC